MEDTRGRSNALIGCSCLLIWVIDYPHTNQVPPEHAPPALRMESRLLTPTRAEGCMEQVRCSRACRACRARHERASVYACTHARRGIVALGEHESSPVSPYRIADRSGHQYSSLAAHRLLLAGIACAITLSSIARVTSTAAALCFQINPWLFIVLLSHIQAPRISRCVSMTVSRESPAKCSASTTRDITRCAYGWR